MTIYIDVLFLSNLLINTAIIFCTSVITKSGAKLMRIVIGGVISAIYSVTAFFPHTELLYTVIGKISFSILFIIVFYKCKRVSELVKKLAVFFGVSFLTCGLSCIAVFQFSGFVSNGVPYFDVNLKLLAASTILTVILIKIYISVFQRNFSKDKIIHEVEFTVQGQKINAKILLDTGCELKEPISGKPVILVNHDFFGESQRFVNFKTASDGCGEYIPIYSPENLVNKSQGDLRLNNDFYVGFIKNSFSDDGLYNGVAPPEAFTENDNLIKNRGHFNVSKAKEACMEFLLKICKSSCRKGLLHRRKRHPSSSSKSGRRTVLDPNAQR